MAEFTTGQKIGAGIGAGIAGIGLLQGMRPPDIPDPIKPPDFTANERDRLRDVVTHGDPLREDRERRSFNRILTNSNTDIVGPSAAFTLAAREDESQRAGQQISQVMGQLDEQEDQFRFGAEGQLNQLTAERGRDLDEYRQQVAAKEAAEEVQRKNFASGLLRSGLNLAGTLLAPATGGASLLATEGINQVIGEGETSYDPSVGFNAMSPEASGRMFNNTVTSPTYAPDNSYLLPDDPFDTGGNSGRTFGLYG